MVLLANTILNNSESFLGALISIIVLCIFLTKNNNFLFEIIEDIYETIVCTKENIENSLRDIEDLTSKFDDLLNRATKIKKNESNQLRDTISSSLYSLNIYNTELSIIQPIFDPIQSKKFGYQRPFELTLAPLFSLLLGILIFFLDFLSLENAIDLDFISVFILIFTTISICYSFSIWFTYVKKERLKFSPDLKEKNKFYVNKINIPRKVIKIMTPVIIFLFLWILIIGFFYANKSNYWKYICDYKLIFLMITTGVSIPGIGLIRLNKFNNKYQNYPVLFIFSHFFYFAVLSVLLAFLYNWINYNYLPTNLGLLDGFFNHYISLIRIIFFSYILLNGLILPVIFPIIISYVDKIGAENIRKKAIKERKKYRQIYDDCNNRVNELLRNAKKSSNQSLNKSLPIENTKALIDQPKHKNNNPNSNLIIKRPSVKYNKGGRRKK